MLSKWTPVSFSGHWSEHEFPYFTLLFVWFRTHINKYPLSINFFFTSSLYGNNIGNEGAVALAEALKLNTSLVLWTLEWAWIFCSHVFIFVSFHTHNKWVFFLKINFFLFNSLECNNIGNEGTVALTEALKVNTSLRSL